MQINFAAKELTIKLVYYGPALSGKTTNLKSLHALTSKEARGRLMTLETKDDRTLFFDMLPLAFKAKDGGASLRIKVLTVPGQVVHGSTRRLVLQGADGILFVADSQVSETENNAASFLDLRSNLKELGLTMRDMPTVIQFNKRDLPNIRSQEEIEGMAKKGREPIFLARAVDGDGVLESFFGLLKITWSRLEAENQLERTLGLSAAEVLPLAHEKLGVEKPLSELLSKSLGFAISDPRFDAPRGPRVPGAGGIPGVGSAPRTGGKP